MFRILTTIASYTILLFALELDAHANDNIFPPAPSAAKSINFDGHGFSINGQRIFIVSAGMEYSRVPRPLWADRLMRIKRAGFNCIELYTFWNYHEPQSGKFDFSANRDLDAYLKLAKSLGLYAIVRIGPYSCAEWDSGGYPVWLRFVPGLQVRTNDPLFEKYVARFWDQLLPIIVKNQINRGGNVILVQLENEHPDGWGTENLMNPYFKYLQTIALKKGLEVPYFFSGLHHGHDPAGDAPWSAESRSSPWLSTEFWCNWFDVYGETDQDAQEKGWETWKIIAYGGNGYNYYMAHGGSNFDYFNDDEDSASYDYGAAIGQTGDLRPEYYKFKGAAWFARSFEDILETSDNASGEYSNISTNPSIAVTARHSDVGTILFFANAGPSSQSTQFTFNNVLYPKNGTLTIAAKSIVPVVTGYSIIPGVTMAVAPAKIFGITQQAETTTIVIYGQPGTPAELYFDVPRGTSILDGSKNITVNVTNLALQTAYPNRDVLNYSFKTGSKRVRILVMSSELADDTWFAEIGHRNYVVCGPKYIGEAESTNGVLCLKIETPWQSILSNQVSAFDDSDSPIRLFPSSPVPPHPAAIDLTSWQTQSGAPEANMNYNTSGWLSNSAEPLQMGADGDPSCYVWYRTTINVPFAGTYRFSVESIADHMIPFLDGIPVSACGISANSFSANLISGPHSMAIFVSHDGRNKLVGYVGPISRMYMKGLSGSVHMYALHGSTSESLTNWETMPATSGMTRVVPPSHLTPAWKKYAIGDDAFNEQAGYAWFETLLPKMDSADVKIADFKSVDDNCWVYLNGAIVASNSGWNVPFSVNLSHGWKPNHTNILSLLVQNESGIGGLDSAVTLNTYPRENTITNWVQKGGLADPNPTSGWQVLSNQAIVGPHFFRTTFLTTPSSVTRSNPMWRVCISGLSKGTMWINGHNLGRYPEKIPAPGIYIPECWLNSESKSNILMIFDEDGHCPQTAVVRPEYASSRDVQEFTGMESKKSRRHIN